MQKIANRIGDVLLAGFLLTLTAPLIGLIVFLIKMESRGGAFNSEERRDPRGYRSEVLKFRTAEIANHRLPAWGTRITRVGRLLRWSRLDGLPQLVNVLRGDLTLLGSDRPRPDFLC